MIPCNDDVIRMRSEDVMKGEESEAEDEIEGKVRVGRGKSESKHTPSQGRA